MPPAYPIVALDRQGLIESLLCPEARFFFAWERENRVTGVNSRINCRFEPTRARLRADSAFEMTGQTYIIIGPNGRQIISSQARIIWSDSDPEKRKITFTI